MTYLVYGVSGAAFFTSAYLLIFRKNRPASAFLFAVAVKALAAGIAFCGAAGGAQAYAACLGALCAGVFAFAAAAARHGRSSAVLPVLLAVVLAHFFQGCGGGIRLVPQVSAETETGFVPARLTAAGKGEVYVGAANEKNVYLFSLKEKKKLKAIPAGYGPGRILARGNMIFIANEKNASVTFYNRALDTAESIDCGGEYPFDLEYNQAKDLLYVSNTGSGNVAVISVRARAVKNRIQTGKWPSGLYLTPDARHLYVACKYTNTVQMIDTENERMLFTKIDAGVSPVQLVPLGSGRIAIINEWEYSFNQKSSILLFNTGDYSIKSAIGTEGGIEHAVLSKSRKFMYVSVPLKDKVIFIDMEKGRVDHSIYLRNAVPKWLALSRDGSELYVSAPNAGRIYTIELNGYM